MITLNGLNKQVQLKKVDGVLQKEIAEKLGYSKEHFCRMIGGKTNLDFEFLDKACTYFKCDVRDLVEYISENENYTKIEQKQKIESFLSQFSEEDLKELCNIAKIARTFQQK